MFRRKTFTITECNQTLVLLFRFLIFIGFFHHAGCNQTLVVWLFLCFFLTGSRMAASSSSHQQNQEFSAFSGIKPGRITVSESSKLYDVFINHRGPDVRETVVLKLSNSLQQMGIRVYPDSQEKELGISFPSTIETAIRSASVHIAIFSKRFAESPWCLAELDLMLQSNAKFIPVFYQVAPWELRHIEKGQYAAAFIRYEEKGIFLEKLSKWKESLNSVSFIAGEEFHRDCKTIVAAVEKEVRRNRCVHVANYPAGLNDLVKDFERRCLDELVEDFENQCGHEEREKKPNVVGIFGLGGVGKTTLAKELFNRKLSNYSRASFLFDVREASARRELSCLQSQLVKDLFHKEQSLKSTEEGTSIIRDTLQRNPFSNFLIVVDDIDHVEQLDALLVMDILNKPGNSLVIVTARDVGVFISAGISLGYHLKGMDRNHGRQLFCWHAFNQPLPSSGYEALVDQFVDVCGGLPLSLQVLGRHVHGRSPKYWELNLIKARKTLPRNVKERLRISFDALDNEEKQVFIDIACFFFGKSKFMAERILEGSGWNAQHALETLKDRCLVEETEISSLRSLDESVLRMHDHLRDLGREMAAELSPPHRLWRPQDLKHLESITFKTILAKTDIRCFHSLFDESLGSRVTFFLGQSDICLERSASLLWLQLENDSTEQRSIPSWIPLQKLQCLKIKGGQFKTWQENRYKVPHHLKELQISETSLKEIPDILGIATISSLEKLEIRDEECVSKILIDALNYPGLKSIKLHYMKNLLEVDLRVKTLNCVEITNCESLKSVSEPSYLAKLVEMKISDCGNLEFENLCLSSMECLERITFERNGKWKYLELDACQKLKTIKLGCQELLQLSIHKCPLLEELSGVSGSRSFLERIVIDGCGNLKSLELISCQNLKSISGHFELRQLYIVDCPELEELPSLARASCLEEIQIDSCEKLQGITLPTTIICLSVQSCSNLQRVAGTSDPLKLTMLIISECPNLEELPNLTTLSCLKQIEIKHCNKLQNITLPTTLIRLYIRSCRDLVRVAGTNDLTELEEFEISDCGKLEFEDFWGDKEHAPLQLRELIITGTWSASFKKFPSSIPYLNNLKKIALLGDVGKGFGIKELPEEFCDLQLLERLELRHCTLLSSMPDRFGDLRNLQHLDLCSCKALRMLPLSFQQLKLLSYLNLSGCKRLLLQEDILKAITQLKNLNLSGCLALQKIPHRITDQEFLRELQLQHTHLQDLPNDIGQLSKLEVLTIGSPLLKKLPDSLGNLSRLKSLSIIDCILLECLPKTLGQLVFLEHLCIEGTGLRSLPEGFRQLANLRTLRISDCPLSELNFGSVSPFSLEKLREINLSETRVTRISISEHCCPRLQTLQLSKNIHLQGIETLPPTVKIIELS